MPNKPSQKNFQLTGTENITPQSFAALFGFLAFVALIGFYFFGGLDWWTSKELGNIYEQTAKDLESQYRLMGTESSEIDKCVKAGTVAAAWLQAQNEPNYQSWKSVEKGHCQAAGIEN